MTTRFDHHEAVLQFEFAVKLQDAFQFRMYRVHGGGQTSQIKDSGPATLHKYDSTEVAVAGYEDSPLFMGDSQKLAILGLR